jgi:hypothetical protein
MPSDLSTSKEDFSMNHFMLPTTRAYSPSQNRLRFAIDRFLDGKMSAMQLQSWCYAHFEQLDSSVDELEQQFWTTTMLNLGVFHRCDLHRSALEQSLEVLVASIDATGIACATPLTRSACCHEMLRRDRRNGDFEDRQVAIALGYVPCQ